MHLSSLERNQGNLSPFHRSQSGVEDGRRVDADFEIICFTLLGLNLVMGLEGMLYCSVGFFMREKHLHQRRHDLLIDCRTGLLQQALVNLTAY